MIALSRHSLRLIADAVRTAAAERAVENARCCALAGLGAAVSLYAGPQLEARARAALDQQLRAVRVVLGTSAVLALLLLGALGSRARAALCEHGRGRRAPWGPREYTELMDGDEDGAGNALRRASETGSEGGGTQRPHRRREGAPSVLSWVHVLAAQTTDDTSRTARAPTATGSI